MFLREVKRQNRNGTQVSYLQLGACHGRCVSHG
jgi:hypothetical protein